MSKERNEWKDSEEPQLELNLLIKVKPKVEINSRLVDFFHLDATPLVSGESIAHLFTSSGLDRIGFKDKPLDSFIFWDCRTRAGFRSPVLWQELLVVVRTIQKLSFWFLRALGRSQNAGCYKCLQLVVLSSCCFLTVWPWVCMTVWTFSIRCWCGDGTGGEGGADDVKNYRVCEQGIRCVPRWRWQAGVVTCSCVIW